MSEAAAPRSEIPSLRGHSRRDTYRAVPSAVSGLLGLLLGLALGDSLGACLGACLGGLHTPLQSAIGEGSLNDAAEEDVTRMARAG
eukprot:1154926-Pelagomonas_calceolata.AAC.1